MKSLTVWARPGLPSDCIGDVALWEDFLPESAPDSWVSIPEQVDVNRTDLRSRYQAWLTEVSQKKLDTRALAASMKVRPDLSYWWMTLPTDNSLEMNSPAYSIVRLFALDDAFDGRHFESVRIVADRSRVANAIAAWASRICDKVDVELGGGCTNDSKEGPGFCRTRLAAVRVIWNHLLIALRRDRKVGRSSIGEGITLVDYLAHLADPGPKGAFRSNYWGPLVPLLDKWPEPVSYIHVSPTYASPSVVEHDFKVVQGFNHNFPGHSVLHSYLRLRTVMRAIRDYRRIQRFGAKLNRRLEIFCESSSGLDPSPFLNTLINDQYFGRTAALNAFWISLWESALNDMPTQRLGMYLFENQPWELALIRAWKRAGHGNLVAVAHSTVPYWDMRIFNRQTRFASSYGLGHMPLPNLVAVNGPAMRKRLLDGGYPSTHLLDVEAIRYVRSEAPREPNKSGGLVLLVLGEYSQHVTTRLLEEVKQALSDMCDTFQVKFRPHPASTPLWTEPPAWLQIDDRGSAVEALSSADIVVCGALSSAAVESALQGRQTFLLADREVFRASPAEDLDCTWVNTGAQLRGALKAQPKNSAQGQSSVRPSASEEYFWFDTDLRRWQSLLRRPS